MSNRILPFFFLIGNVFAFQSSLIFAQPVITDLSLRSLQIGKPVTLAITGRNLTKGTRVYFPFQFDQKTLNENGTNNCGIQITLPKGISPGVYPLRVFNTHGVSQPMLIGIDRLPTLPFAAKCNLPTALTGTAVGAQIRKTSFVARKDELVVAEIEANRLGSKLRPVIHIYDERGKQVAFSQPMRSLNGDSRCLLRVPKDGTYHVELHDFLFRGASPGFFRFKLGQMDFADLTVPIGVEVGKKTVVRTIKLGTDAESLVEITPTSPGWMEVPMESNLLFSGIRPLVLASQFTEFVEPEDHTKVVDAGTVPLGINGRVGANREVDRYRINVKPGSKLRFDLFGRRIGSAIDGRIVVKLEDGKVLGTNDDRPGQKDALLDVNVPGGINKLVVEISDVTSLGSKSHVYRLGVTEQNTKSISATTTGNIWNCSVNGSILIPISIQRANYSGPVQIKLLSSDSSLNIAGTEIPANADKGLVTLNCNAKGPTSFSLVATTPGPDGANSLVVAPENGVQKGFSPLRSRFLIAPVTEKTFNIAWKPPGNSLSLGGQVQTPIEITRSTNLTGNIRIRLLTNQKIPKKRIRKNNKDTFVDDLEKTIRAANVELKPGELSTNLNIMVPVDIPESDFDLIAVAELLSSDKKTVLQSTSTVTMRFSTKRMVNIEIADGKLLSLPRSGTGKLKVKGKITQRPPDAPIRVTLNRLPDSVKVAPVMVPAGQSEFQIELSIPVNAELLKLKKLELDLAAIDPKDAKRVLGKAKPVPVSIKLQPEKKKPNAPKKQPPAKKKKA